MHASLFALPCTIPQPPLPRQSLLFLPIPSLHPILPSSPQYYRSIESHSPVCPCRRATNKLGSFSRLTVSYDSLCDPGIIEAWGECRRNMACTGDSSDTVLLVLGQFCILSQKVSETVVGAANARLVVTPAVMQEAAMGSLVAGAKDEAFHSIISQVTIPTIMTDMLIKMENFLSVVGLWGNRVPTTALAPALGGGSWRVGRGGLREWTFSGKSCFAQQSKVECGMTPFCRWEEAEQRCDNALCPLHTPKGPSCPQQNPNHATSLCFFVPTVGCVMNACQDRENTQQCETTSSSPYPISKHTPGICVARVGNVRDTCQWQQLSCGDFRSKHDCTALAPKELCGWNGATTQCEFFGNISCPDGTTSDAGTATCLASEASAVTFHPSVPSYVIHSWPNSPLSSSLPIPELLIFSPTSANTSDSFSSIDPLWRLTTGNSSNPCNCIEDPFCSSDNITLTYFPDDPNETPLVYTRTCQRYNTVGTFSSNIVTTKAWTAFYNVSTPTTRPSRYATIDEGFQNAFIDSISARYSFEAYFDRCNPSSCSYTVKNITDPLTALTWLLGILGGFSVMAQGCAKYSATMLCKGCIQRHIAAHPELYGSKEERRAAEEKRLSLQPDNLSAHNPLHKAHHAAESGVLRLLTLVAELEAHDSSSDEEEEEKEGEKGGWEAGERGEEGVPRAASAPRTQLGPTRRKKRASRRKTIRNMIKEQLQHTRADPTLARDP